MTKKPKKVTADCIVKKQLHLNAVDVDKQVDYYVTLIQEFITVRPQLTSLGILAQASKEEFLDRHIRRWIAGPRTKECTLYPLVQEFLDRGFGVKTTDLDVVVTWHPGQEGFEYKD